MTDLLFGVLVCVAWCLVCLVCFSVCKCTCVLVCLGVCGLFCVGLVLVSVGVDGAVYEWSIPVSAFEIIS